MKELHADRFEMVKAIEKQRKALDMSKNVPKASYHNIIIGSYKLFKKELPRNQWVGPYKVIGGNNKNVLLTIDSHIVTASDDEVKLCKRPSTPVSPKMNAMDSTLDYAISCETF